MDMLSALWDGFIDGLTKVLPLSPFQQYLEDIEALPYLGWLNWFFPVRDCLNVMYVWLGAVGLFYMYSVIMRWLKVVGD